ncbi:hypothetical protein AAFF_G00211870 [Aldrovandia affinis]|uniref:Uncharacterized protein n=1 Tax=Aldrovandia affinis TaxID=143900 RepID=A0AAD7RHB0_9TELE|nr:hypothetical protein AAFF_G00211870 [Aldrovandia affinis]
MSEATPPWGPILPATQKVQDLCDKFLPEINIKLHKNYRKIKATQYRKRTVQNHTMSEVMYKIWANAETDTKLTI